ncbi:MAG: hypothetical protein ACI8RZ_001481 [Myxococcota bacterium]|jgi:hypothetical protein
MDERTITNLDGIEALLKTRLNEATYLAVSERRGNAEEQLAKLTLPELSEWANASTWGEQADAAFQWIRLELLGIADGPRTSFRVAVWGGGGRLIMRTCVVLDSQAVVSAGSPVEEAMAEVGAQGVFQLGASWERFTTVVMRQADDFKEMCLSHMKEVDVISRAQTATTAKDMAAAREQVNTLVGEVTKARIGVAAAKAEVVAAEAMAEVEVKRKAVEAQQSEVNRELAKGALDQMGSFGKALLFSKTGMSAELTEVATALQTNPEMMEALKDPLVREQLKNADNLSFIAASLKQAVEVERAKAKADAATPADPSGSEPSE